MRTVQKICNGMGLVSEWTGKTARWLVVIIIVIVCYDVFMRYALNMPTDWAWCLSYMLGACLFTLGFSYTYRHAGHARVDVIYSRLPPKGRLIIDVLSTFFLGLPFLLLLLMLFIDHAWFVYSISQVDDRSTWYPLTWPYKAVIAIGFVILFSQAIATFLKDVMALVKGGKEPW